MMTTIKILLWLVIVTVVAGVASAQAPATKLKVGDKAPDFALPNGDGKLVVLSEVTTRTPVVLVFYRGFW
jgi:peroxiredoxin